MRSCYNETSVRYFDIRQFTNTMLNIKTFISLFHPWNGRSRLIIVFQVLGPCLSKARFWFQIPEMMATVGFRLCAYLLCLQKAKACLGMYWIPKIMAQFCYLRLYLGFETIFPVVCLSYGWQGWTWSEQLEKFFFMSLCYAGRNHPRIIMVGDPRSQFRFFVPPFSNIEQVGPAFFSNFG